MVLSCSEDESWALGGNMGTMLESMIECVVYSSERVGSPVGVLVGYIVGISVGGDRCVEARLSTFSAGRGI